MAKKIEEATNKVKNMSSEEFKETLVKASDADTFEEVGVDPEEDGVLTKQNIENFIETYEPQPRPDMHEVGVYPWQLEFLEEYAEETGECGICGKEIEDCEYWEVKE